MLSEVLVPVNDAALTEVELTVTPDVVIFPAELIDEAEIDEAETVPAK